MSSETVSTITRHSPRTSMSAIPMGSTSNQSRRQENGQHWDKSSTSSIGGTHVIDDESNNQTSDQQSIKDGGSATDTKQAASSRRNSASNSPCQSSSNGSRTSSDDDSAERVRPSTRNPSTSLSSMSLPSISLTTQGQINNRGSGSTNDRAKSQSRENNFHTANGDDHPQHQRSHSHERAGNTNNSCENRWSNISNDKDDGSGANGDDHGLGYSGGDDSRRYESPTSPNGPSGQEDVRIMFHGREIYADDLVGLRVAKTFVGHGRFLGQVVKFDDATALYTVVYADGDAEELTIDNTIRILIQDEIERADPLVPPVLSSTSFQHERMTGMDSPEGSSTPVSSTTTSASVPSIAPVAPPPGPQHRRSSTDALNISAREAQFVIGLFENHALPILLRQGWRVQSNSSGTEQRYWAPPGNFRGAGQIFPSALDVVELIASDSDTLSLCFPSNVHSAILSLFPEVEGTSTSASRKRLPVGSMDVEMAYDTKRVRSERDEAVSGGSNLGVRDGGLARTGLAGRPARDSVDQRLVPPVSYRTECERDPYGANGRGIPSISSDRFGSGGGSRNARVQSDRSRGGPSTSLHEPEYRRSPGGMYHSTPLHSISGTEGGHGLRWPGAKQMEGEDDYHSSYRERVGDWDERGGRDPGYMNERATGNRVPIYRPTSEFDYHPSSERMSYFREGGRGGAGQNSIAGGVDTPPQSYRYRGVRSNAPSGGQYSPHADLFLHRHPSERESPSSSSPPEYQISSVPPPPSSAERFSRPLSRANCNSGMLPSVRPASGERSGPSSGGRGFSMMDVDRANGSRPGPSGYERMDTGRGRSPHTGELNAPNVYSQYLGGSSGKRKGTHVDSPDTLNPDVRPGSGSQTSNATDESRVI